MYFQELFFQWKNLKLISDIFVEDIFPFDFVYVSDQACVSTDKEKVTFP